MLDIRTLLLGAPEDRYAPSAALREAELRLFPLLSRGGQGAVGPATECPASAMEALPG